jgi:hypothetical protein
MITISRGDTITIPVEIVDADDVAIDITGYTLWFTVRKNIPATSIKTDDDAIIAIKQEPDDLTDPTNGKTDIELTSILTDINPATYYYDFQYETPAGIIKSSDPDTLVIKGDITRAR